MVNRNLNQTRWERDGDSTSPLVFQIAATRAQIRTNASRGFSVGALLALLFYS
jgi:hypothetical protein